MCLLTNRLIVLNCESSRQASAGFVHASAWFEVSCHAVNRGANILDGYSFLVPCGKVAHGHNARSKFIDLQVGTKEQLHVKTRQQRNGDYDSFPLNLTNPSEE